MYCPNCNKITPNDSRFCTHCGIKLSLSTDTFTEDTLKIYPDEQKSGQDASVGENNTNHSSVDSLTIELDGVSTPPQPIIDATYHPIKYILSNNDGEKSLAPVPDKKSQSVLPISPLLFIIIGAAAIFLLFVGLIIGMLINSSPQSQKDNSFSAPKYRDSSSTVAPADSSPSTTITIVTSVPEPTALPTPASIPESLLTESEYLLPNSSVRRLTTEELDALTEKEIWFARNEIYARYGLRFESKELNEYFSSKAWYHPTRAAGTGDDIPITEIEEWNINFIVDYEYYHGYNGRTKPATRH